MNGKLMSVSIEDDSSHLSFSPAFEPLQRHAGSLRKSFLVLLKLIGRVIDNSLIEIFAARKVSPLVDLTSKRRRPVPESRYRR